MTFFNGVSRAGTVLLTLTGLCFAATAARAADIYVATWGNNSNNGGIGSPVATIEEAANRANWGDHIKLRGGDYYYSEGQYIQKAGITIESQSGEWAVLHGNNAPGPNPGNGYYWKYYFVLQVGNTSNVTVQNLEVRDGRSQVRGIMVYNSNNCRLYRCAVKENGGTGILVEGNTGDLYNTAYRFNEVDNCWVENNSNDNRNRNTGWGIGIGVTRARDTTVKNCSVNGNWGEGIGYYLAVGGTCAYNYVRDNYSVNVYLDNATYVTVENNTIENQGWQDRYRNYGGTWGPASGIQMADENSYLPATNPLRGNTIRNNTVKWCLRGIYYANYEQGGGMKDTSIYGNTVEGNWWTGIGSEYADHGGSQIHDNSLIASGGSNSLDLQGYGYAEWNNWRW